MNPLFAEGAPLAMPLRKLLGAMGNPRASHIVLVTADDETVRQETMAELAERLSGTYSLHEFDYADPPTMSLPRFCRTLSGDGAVCVFAYGLDVLAVRDDKKYQEALHFLNAHREDVRYSHSSVVLWLTSRSLADLREQAPDFADWQNAGARFALPRAQRIERTPLGRLSIAEAEQLRGQVRRFREMLERPNLEAAMAAELRKQLDLAERRLGRIADVRRDYRLHLADELREHVLRGFAPQVGGRVLSLPLAKIFLPLKALEGRPPLAEYADDLRRPEPEAERDELGRQPRGTEEVEKGRARLEVRQAAQRPLRLEELLKERRAVLLGDPGSGKTTVTRYVAYALATGDPTHIGPAVGGLLPVLVRLANFGEALAAEPELTLVDYVGLRLMPQPAFGSCLREAIEAGQCLVILDGLDEITVPQLRIAVTARIESLVHAWGGNRFLVTSRIVGYERSPLTRDFQHATLCELTIADRERFVELWYAAIKAEIRDRSLAAREAELIEALRDKPQIARMAANPLLLTIMVLMHWRGVKLPSRRVQVYQNATETLIEYWTAERVRLDAEEVKQILAPIAHHILSSHAGGVIAQRDLLPRLRAGIVEQRGCPPEEAERLADELLVLLGEQSGIFLERGLDPEGRPVYGFLHQTFGEYLAALQLAGEILAGGFELSRYVHRSAWREPLLLLAGHLALFSQAHAGKLLRSILDFPCPWEGILHRNALLAADCLADDVQVPPALRDETLRKLAELLVNPAGQVREAAAELCQRLAATRHRAPAAAMVKTLPNRPGPGVVRALVSLGERDAAAPLIDLLGKDEGQKLRFEGWPEKADDLLAEWLDSGELSVKIGRDLATCTFGALSAERIRERLGDEGFLRFLEQRAARHPALSLSLSLSLQWITALASDPPASEKIRQLLSSKPPGQIRLWAAIHLLGSEHRATAITVLQELSSEGELKATEALVEADPETVVDWTPVRRTVFRGRRDAVLAIRLLLKGGQVDTGVALLYHLLATEPVHLIVHRGRPTQPFRALAADLVSARRAEPAVALARWLALRPGQDHRVSACEVLLALGEIEEAIRLLTWAAYECHGNVSRRACERLLALGEAELAVPILGQLAASERPDLRYQAALALALANRAPEQLGEVPPEGDKWELTRIRLKTDILADRRRAYRSSLDQLYHAGIAALPPTDPSDPDLAAVTTLAQVSLGWLSGREPVGEETAAIPAKVDPIEADVATALCMLELRRGRLEPGTSQLLTLAKRPDLPPWVRLWVLELFGLIHCRSAIPLLRQASEDPEPAVRATAVEALAQLRLKENADVLVRALRDPDPWVRQVATEGVTKTRDPNAVEALLELLSDKERNIRRQAIAALAVIGNPEAVRGLIRAFEDEDRDPHERRLVIKALIQVADRSSREALAGALSSNDPWLPIAAGAALATLGDSRGCEVLIAALGSEDQWFRNSAANALAALTDPAFTPRLIRLLSHEDAQVRSEIALVLGRRADPAAAPALTKALADEDSRVRANAALTLGWFEHVPATGALIGLLGDEADEVRCQVVLALGFLPAPIDVLLEALGDDGFRVGEAALRSLGRSNDPAAGCALLAALEHEDAWTRAAAANALERRGSIEAVPALIRALGDGIHVVRQHAATALGGLRDRRALRPLTALLNDSAENVCEAAATALGRLQDRAAVDPLIQVLEDIHSGVGSAAVKALGRIGDSAAVPPLIAMAVKFVERGAYYKSLLAPIAQALARLNAVEAVPLLVAIAVPEPEYLSALVHLDAGKARELLDRFATPLRLASWRQRLHGQALWQLGDPDAALLCFREAVSEHAHNVDNHLALAHFHLERDELEGAMEHLERAPRKWESHGLRMLTRAVVVHRRGETERAAVDYESVCREYPELIDHEDLEYEHLWRVHAVAALRELQERD